MSTIEYCNGRPCEMPALLVEAGGSATLVMANMSEDGFNLLDATSELRATSAEVGHYIQNRNAVSQQSYESIATARDAIQQRLADCALCAGLIDDGCPVFSE